MSLTSAALATNAQEPLAPIRVSERIDMLDVVRGFALIGIFLMNIEWFTRPITQLGTGVDTSQSGIDWFASWFIYTFVQGKFWTMFSLLFGMGFAVMLTRAESGQRAFVTPYIRRIIGLFLFGSAHFVMLWTGDILHNYAVTALLLLLIVTRSWLGWFAMLLWVTGIGYAFQPDSIIAVAVFAVLATITGAVIYKRGVERWREVVLLVATAIAAAFSIGEASQGLSMTAGFLGLVAVLMFVLNRGSVDRYYKLGVGMYLLPFVLGLGYVTAMVAVPSWDKKPTPVEAQERVERLAKRAVETTAEIKVLSSGSYLETVAFRARQYREDLPEIVGLSVLALPMFMIGFWFVRAGIVTNLRENLPLFKRLLRWTLPIGLAVTLTSVALHSSFPPGSGRLHSVALARVLFDMGALPLCIGYVSLLVCLLSTQLGERILSPLRYAGRMALTNYLGASLISAVVFFGYGFGLYGQVSRAGQVLFVAAVFSLQLLFSYLWLSRFRYGPMEWLWRAITYWQLPPMRKQEIAPALMPRPSGA